MAKPIRVVQAVLLAFTTFAVLAAVGQQYGLSLFKCQRSCEVVREFALAPLVSLLGIGGMAVLTVLYVRQKDELLRLTALIGGAISIGLSIFMIRSQVVCAGCLVVHCGMVAFALACTGVRYVQYASIPVFCLTQLFALWHWIDESNATPLADFVARPYEPPVKPGRTFVVFTDPNCPACGRLLKSLGEKQLRRNTSILVRWSILSHNSASSMQAAIAGEAVAAATGESAFRYLKHLAPLNHPLEAQQLIATARKFGAEDQVRRALKQPPANVLAAISADGVVAQRLRITHLPAFYAVGRVDTTRFKLLALSEASFLAAVESNETTTAGGSL